MNKILLAVSSLSAVCAIDPRQIVEESQKRQQSQSQRYEGVLEVTQGNGKKSSKRWTYGRIGSFGDSKSINLNFLECMLVSKLSTSLLLSALSFSKMPELAKLSDILIPGGEILTD